MEYLKKRGWTWAIGVFLLSSCGSEPGNLAETATSGPVATAASTIEPPVTMTAVAATTMPQTAAVPDVIEPGEDSIEGLQDWLDVYYRGDVEGIRRMMAPEYFDRVFVPPVSIGGMFTWWSQEDHDVVGDPVCRFEEETAICTVQVSTPLGREIGYDVEETWSGVLVGDRMDELFIDSNEVPLLNQFEEWRLATYPEVFACRQDPNVELSDDFDGVPPQDFIDECHDFVTSVVREFSESGKYDLPPGLS